MKAKPKAKKPAIVYPPEGVVVPPNLNSIEFHFIPAAGQTLFEFTFHAPTTSLSIFTGCSPLNGGCVFKPDAALTVSDGCMSYQIEQVKSAATQAQIISVTPTQIVAALGSINVYRSSCGVIQKSAMVKSGQKSTDPFMFQ